MFVLPIGLTMKYITFLLLFVAVVASAQSDKNISVISIERADIVYRGIINNIKVAVPGAKSFTVDAPGELIKVDSLGNYQWNVTSVAGLKAVIKIKISLANDTTKYEEKEFEIKPIRQRRPYIKSNYGWITHEMTHEQLKNLSIATILDDFQSQKDTLYNKIEHFKISTDGYEDILIRGTKITDNAYDELKQLPNGSELFIHDIYTYNPHQYHVRPIAAIKIKIVENDVNELLIPVIRNEYSNNILYRGIDNRIRVDIPYAKSFEIISPYAKWIAEDSIYSINISHIKEDHTYIDFKIVTKTDSVMYSKALAYIKDIVPKKISVKGKSCKNCKLKMKLSELRGAKIDIVTDEINERQTSYLIDSFTFTTPNNEIIEVRGNIITKEAFQKISKLANKSTLELNVYYFSGGFTYDPPPLKITIIK